MTERQSLILLGGGGHCKAVIDVLEKHPGWKIAGIVDKAEKIGTRVLDYPVVASDQQVVALVREFPFFLVTIGQIQTSQIRQHFYELVKAQGGGLAIVVSPLAYVSAHAQLGEGTVVMHQAVVSAGATVGCNTIVNTGALVEHDARIGHHCHIATGAIVNGGCQVGDHTLIGSRATLVQGVTVAQNVIVGAGAVVNRSISQAGTYAGVPARLIQPR